MKEERVLTEEEMYRVKANEYPFDRYASDLAEDNARTRMLCGGCMALLSLCAFGVTSITYSLANYELGAGGITINIFASVLGVSGVPFAITGKIEKKKSRQNVWAYKNAIDLVWRSGYGHNFAPKLGQYHSVDREIKKKAKEILREANGLEQGK